MCSHSFLYRLVLNEHTLTPLIVTLIYFLIEHAIKNDHKLTTTPSPTVIAAMENHSLPPFESSALVTSPLPGGEEERSRNRGRF